MLERYRMRIRFVMIFKQNNEIPDNSFQPTHHGFVLK
jgi:hypothetical protein